MASEPLVDFAALLAPIPGPDPAGSSLPFEVQEKLEKNRKDEDPESMPPGETARRADWRLVKQVAQEALTQKAKDLRLAARLTEALVKLHGFAGLRDGLRLLRELVEQCWDRLYPPIEDGDFDRRAAALDWLDDPERGPVFPNTVRYVPLVFGEEAAYGWMEWKESQDGKGVVSRDDFDKAITHTPLERCEAVAVELAESLEETNRLVEVLGQKMGESAPALTHVRQAVQDCQGLQQQIVQIKRLAAPPSEPGTDGGAAPAPGQPAPARAVTSRAEAYRQLSQAAAILQQLEPHSPIPYLVQRAVQLGGLSFPQLIKELVRDSNIIKELNRELGIKDEGES
jgi:type VI secretion system protein ImpA